MNHPWFDAGTAPRVLAHRGLVTAAAAVDGVVENSFVAIAEAHAAGASYVESDCHVTADGVVVLAHDADLGRVFGDPRGIADVTVTQLERLMAERGGLITLAQALDTFPSTRFNLDVKVAEAATPVGLIVARHARRVLLTSFSDDRRRAALRASTDAGAAVRPATSAGTATLVRLLIAIRLRAGWLIDGMLAGIDALQIPERHNNLQVLHPRLIRAAHDRGVEVHVWTVNDPDDMRRLLALGVDGLITDRADVALRVVAETL